MAQAAKEDGTKAIQPLDDNSKAVDNAQNEKGQAAN
jgi:hypothetical protein